MRLLSAQKLFFTSYLLFLFFLPTQLGKHFWPPFSFVSGLRIDYLSPTLFFTDILLVLLFASFLLTKHAPIIKLTQKATVLLLLFIGIVILGISFSKQPLSGIIGIFRLGEIVLFGYLTVQFFAWKHAHKAAVTVFCAALLFQSLLGISQFLLKGSVGGIFYFFGERSFSMVTPGIANASIHGALILRPYGTLPHPNVLAGFLLIAILFVIGNWKHLSTRLFHILATLIIGVGTIALFLSLSRTTLALFGILLLGFGGYVLKRSFTKKTVLLLLVLFCAISIIALTTPVAQRFVSSSLFEEAFLFREDVALQALGMIWSHPFVGVGLQNFLYHLPTALSSYSYFTQVQPVHNIYLLVFAEIGVVGGLLFLYFLFSVLRFGVFASHSFWQKTVLVMCGILLFLGLFDHYLLTLQQGRLLLGFVIGLMFSLPRPQSEKHTPPGKKK